MVMEMYRGAGTAVRINGGETEEFGVEVELHQGSALSPLVFVVVMDVVTAEIRDGEKWELVFAGDLVTVADTQEVRSKCTDAGSVGAWQSEEQCAGERCDG
ncbi:uncharacterized protein LOC135089387 [Scylla paramamosain]|uniref:uncharacterized protein LOC135089387 n=1 Tax=Scylla paramamosain TaxID=85552 RepID=UPI00308290F7